MGFQHEPYREGSKPGRKHRANCARESSIAIGLQPIRTYVEVRDEWNELSGENISRSMVYLILTQALPKLREGLRQVAAEHFDDPSFLDA